MKLRRFLTVAAEKQLRQAARKTLCEIFTEDSCRGEEDTGALHLPVSVTSGVKWLRPEKVPWASDSAHKDPRRFAQRHIRQQRRQENRRMQPAGTQKEAPPEDAAAAPRAPEDRAPGQIDADFPSAGSSLPWRAKSAAKNLQLRAAAGRAGRPGKQDLGSLLPAPGSISLHAEAAPAPQGSIAAAAKAKTVIQNRRHPTEEGRAVRFREAAGGSASGINHSARTFAEEKLRKTAAKKAAGVPHGKPAPRGSRPPTSPADPGGGGWPAHLPGKTADPLSAGAKSGCSRRSPRGLVKVKPAKAAGERTLTSLRMHEAGLRAEKPAATAAALHGRSRFPACETSGGRLRPRTRYFAPPNKAAQTGTRNLRHHLAVQQTVRRRQALTHVKEMTRRGLSSAGRTAAAACRMLRPSRESFLAAGLFLLLIVLLCTVAVSTAGGMYALAESAQGAGYLEPAVVTELKGKVEAAYAAYLQEMRDALTAAGIAPEDIDLVYNDGGEGDTDFSIPVDNWMDVLAVWLVQAQRPLQAADEESLREIYFAMNPVRITESVREVTGHLEILPDGTVIPVAEPRLTACLHIENLRYTEAQDLLGLSGAQTEMIASWIAPGTDAAVFWQQIAGLGVAGGEDYSQEAWYTGSADTGLTGRVLLEAARRNGWVYSQAKRMSAGYADCSSLVWGCYHAAGLDIGSSTYAPTAAELARWCDERGLRVASSDRQPGDLIFWAGKNNGRYLNIYHVAVYAGDGKMWEAAPSAGGVVYRDVTRQRPAQILFYARPAAV